MKFDFLDKLTDAQKKWLQWLGIVLVIGVLGFFGITYPQIPVPPLPSGEIGAQAVAGAIRCGANGSYGACFRAENGGNIAVFSDGGATSKFSVTGSSGNVSNAGSWSVGTFAVLTAGSTISTTNGNPFTPTATYQPIESAGTVTPTLAITNSLGVAYSNGTLLRLVNLSNTSIILVDSGNVKLAGTWTAGQYDSLTLVFDSTSATWVEIARSDN